MAKIPRVPVENQITTLSVVKIAIKFSPCTVRLSLIIFFHWEQLSIRSYPWKAIICYFSHEFAYPKREIRSPIWICRVPGRYHPSRKETREFSVGDRDGTRGVRVAACALYSYRSVRLGWCALRIRSLICWRRKLSIQMRRIVEWGHRKSRDRRDGARSFGKTTVWSGSPWTTSLGRFASTFPRLFSLRS